MAEYCYVMKGLTKTVPGGKEVLSNIWLSFLPGVKIGVIGPNGAGKSTLLKIMAGVDTQFEGEAWAARGYSVGYLPQEPELDGSKSVRENVLDGLGETAQLVGRFNELTAKLAEPMDDDEMQRVYEEMGDVQDKIDAADAWDLDRKIEIAMDALRVPDADDVTVLSGGEKRRAALCKLLLSRPDILLLDEPTNHLDADTVAWLQRHLADYPGMVVAITHDRYFLDQVAEWILELDRGKGHPFEGNYSGWLEQKQERLRQEEKEESARQRQLAEEADWVKASPQGRRTKARARIQAYEALLNQERPKQVTKPIIMIPEGPRLGDVVVDANGVLKGFGDKLLYEDLTFELPPGGIVGIIGPNGAGKTTLFRMIVSAAGFASLLPDGEESPDEGELRVGDTVQLSYVDQSRQALASDKTVFEEITGGGDWVQLGKTEMSSRAYVAAFGFKGGEQQKNVGSCSGGERNRIHLAKLLQNEANLLLLDEPTNDLDVDTLRSLEEALLEFPGCAVITSHDRWFLDRVATHILAFEGDSQVTWFPGGYSEYEQDLRKRKGEDALNPTRIKYRPLTRRSS
ncbi:energy-dependent translational throttle protein EttA [Egicoccus halophilus]|uniref:Energy-dependent translational throttle protein EttA n=2 Tax=Egicoccus halophilus TaxID=1670830 RepID=A0A8J3A7Q1_9ACTN|nr:energy-dependent translational throttle protein EttA [Egicoccus halophilus]GGI03614.1 energy-dependent translational throttle protein EttA [Egicoccus halophilus]